MHSRPLVPLGILFTIAITACGDQQPAPADPPPEAAAEKPKHTNKLAGETSPYLLQHAHNPVNWYPWGKEAFEKAKREDKPIFLSVGYSTCYWCHVMERESFEDEEVAKVLNEHYVAIKVDREELPDVDEQYMLATQLISGRGGWPNSVWLDTEGTPWMAGTYFPKQQFIGVLERLAQFWEEDRQVVTEQADRLAAAIRRNASSLSGRLTEETLDRALIGPAFADMQESFDAAHGGFGSAPKFPPHGQLALLAQELRREPNKELEKLMVTTLDSMWRGGIHDHVGGGFHRYSTDGEWLLPHFEKMLYDNAQLMRAYADAYELTGHERYREAAADIFSWIEREMTGDDGGFYSALDSESDGEEGRFYVWSIAELNEVLGEDDAKLFAEVYSFTAEGNFEEERTGERTGHNIPHLEQPLDEFANQRNMAADELSTKLATLRAKLLKARMQREYPHRDDKILTAWNGLMITALARAGEVFEEPEYTEAASRAALFLWTRMWQDGTLLRIHRGGDSKIPGYLNDYAFYAEGLMELHRTTGKDRWLEFGLQVTDAMVDKFEDTEAGGFYFASEEHADLIARSKNLQGGGNLPSGNGVAAQVLLRVAAATGEPEYAASARRALESFSGLMARAPLATESLLLATADLLESDYADADPPAKPAADDPKAVASYAKKPVTAKVYLSQPTVKPGDKIKVKVTLAIEKGWHLYGPNVDNEFVIATTVTPSAVEGLSFGEVGVPEAVKKNDPVLKEVVEVYEEEIAFTVPVTVGEGFDEQHVVLPLTLKIQACDENRCLTPVTKILEVPLEVVR